MSQKNNKVLQTTIFHKKQVSLAKRFIRKNFNKDLSLDEISKYAGSSTFHFSRMFMAYTGESPFSYLRRIRLLKALEIMHSYENKSISITDIALYVGYETPSAFNKVFKKNFDLNPTQLRNLGKESIQKLVYNLKNKHKPKEIPMGLDVKYDIIKRPETHYIFIKKNGPFEEIAMLAWHEMFPKIEGISRKKIKEYIGLSIIDHSKKDDDSMVYNAGIALDEKPQTPYSGLEYINIPEGHYARFILTGPWPQIWPAFETIFKIVDRNNLKIREQACIENYISDPNDTPEEELITELLVPIISS